jgi:hypothetical protein
VRTHVFFRAGFRGVARSGRGANAANPFLGVMASLRSQSHNRELRAAGKPVWQIWTCVSLRSGLYLPVFNDGALFYVGDPHGLKGDGEGRGCLELF